MTAEDAKAAISKRFPEAVLRCAQIGIYFHAVVLDGDGEFLASSGWVSDDDSAWEQVLKALKP